MVEYEKVIKGIECCLGDTRSDLPNLCTICPYSKGSYATLNCSKLLREDAIAVLKTKVPLTVIFDVNGYTGEPVPKCPMCRAPIDKCFDYCPSCGQALKWMIVDATIEKGLCVKQSERQRACINCGQRDL